MFCVMGGGDLGGEGGEGGAGGAGGAGGGAPAPGSVLVLMFSTSAIREYADAAARVNAAGAAAATRALGSGDARDGSSYDDKLAAARAARAMKPTQGGGEGGRAAGIGTRDARGGGGARRGGGRGANRRRCAEPPHHSGGNPGGCALPGGGRAW